MNLNSFIHSDYFYSTSSSPLLLRGSPDSTGTVPEFHAGAPQATVSEGLAQSSYVAARGGVEQMSLQTKGVDSTNAPPTPQIVCHFYMYRGHLFMTSTVHMEGEVGQAQVDTCGRGERGQAPCGRPHRKLKLEPTDIILSSSHAKKLASFLPEFHLWTE